MVNKSFMVVWLEMTPMSMDAFVDDNQKDDQKQKTMRIRGNVSENNKDSNAEWTSRKAEGKIVDMTIIRKVVIIEGIGVKAEEYEKVEARPEPRKPKIANSEDVVFYN